MLGLTTMKKDEHALKIKKEVTKKENNCPNT